MKFLKREVNKTFVAVSTIILFCLGILRSISIIRNAKGLYEILILEHGNADMLGQNFIQLLVVAVIGVLLLILIFKVLFGNKWNYPLYAYFIGSLPGAVINGLVLFSAL